VTLIALTIAGDGYAYVGYSNATACSGNCQVNHVGLLRVSSSGAWDQIPMVDYVTGIKDIPDGHLDGLITNADTGVLAVVRGDTEYLVTTAGTAVASVAAAPALNGVSPVLQAQDGSYVGTL
jgi:hypothetical protein